MIARLFLLMLDELSALVPVFLMVAIMGFGFVFFLVAMGFVLVALML